jgi:hypothetical protein
MELRNETLPQLLRSDLIAKEFPKELGSSSPKKCIPLTLIF